MLVQKYRPKRRNADDIWTVPQIAQLWGISASAAYDAARRGEIPGLFTRGRRKFVWMPEFRKTFPEAGR